MPEEGKRPLCYLKVWFVEIFGVVASPRRLGNSEFLVKEAIRAAQRQGAAVSLVG